MTFIVKIWFKVAISKQGIILYLKQNEQVTYYRMEMIHMSQDIILFKTFKTPLRAPERKKDIQLEYFEEDKRYEKNIHDHTDTLGGSGVAKTCPECLRP
jgi:hypothetical protein